MSDTVIHADSYGSLLYAPEVPCLIVQWHGFANSQQFRHLLDRCIVEFERRAERTWPLGLLADCRQMSAIVPADQIWLETDWNPRVYEAGVGQLAIVAAESIFGRIATQVYTANTVAQTHYSIEPVTLPTLDEAKDWLKAQLDTYES